METSFHVSPGGSDANPGTRDRPFATLARARDAVRATIANGMNGDAVVELDAGTYFVAAPVRLDDRDGGRDGHHVVYRGPSRGDAVVYGGIPVEGWEPWKGGVYRARLDVGRPFHGLFEDGRAAVLARHPNDGDGYGGGITRVDGSHLRIPAEWTRDDFTDAWVFAWLGPNWSSTLLKVKAIDREKAVIEIPGGEDINDRLYLQGVLGLLDEPGEWCFRSREQCVYYWPRGTPIESRLIVAATAPSLFDLRGRAAEQPVRDVRIERIHFIGTDGLDPSASDGLIRIENAERIEVRACRLTGAGHIGVRILGQARGCTVRGCWIEGAGLCGVSMEGFAPGAGPFKSAAESYVNRGHVISNNVLTDCGQRFGHGCGIAFSHSGDNELTHNLIRRMPRYGISYKGIRYGALPDVLYGKPKDFAGHFDVLHTRNNRIAFNDIGNVCRDSHDFGGIECWGPGRDNVWEFNAVHDIDQPVDWDGWGHALFTDDGSHHHKVRGNVVYFCQGGAMSAGVMIKSVDQAVENNVFADNVLGQQATVQPYVEPAGEMVCSRNIFEGAVHQLYLTGNNTREAVREIDRNLIWPPCPKLPEYRALGWDRNSVEADPKFDVRHPPWDRTCGDYALKPDSPALGFEPIPMDRIGLLPDFPFDAARLGRRAAGEKIQAEDYTRMRGVRTQGATGIYRIGPGAWVKYASVDFTSGGFRRVVFSLFDPADAAPAQSGAAPREVQIRSESPEGPLLGRLPEGQTTCLIDGARGIQTIYLTFPTGWTGGINWFRFELK